MANTYTWDFPTLDVHNTAQNGHDDVIQTIHWRVTAVSDSEQDADGNYLQASMYGTAGLTTPEADDPNFVTFNSVTKDWCKTKTLESLSKTEDEMQTMLDDQMTALANPPMRQAVPAGW
jgi:hypothetical protein